jgi:hypothetical protein
MSWIKIWRLWRLALFKKKKSEYTERLSLLKAWRHTYRWPDFWPSFMCCVAAPWFTGLGLSSYALTEIACDLAQPTNNVAQYSETLIWKVISSRWLNKLNAFLYFFPMYSLAFVLPKFVANHVQDFRPSTYHCYLIPVVWHIGISNSGGTFKSEVRHKGANNLKRMHPSHHICSPYGAGWAQFLNSSGAKSFRNHLEPENRTAQSSQ